jgi:hypothetical protein
VIVRIVDEGGPSGIAYPEDDDAAGLWFRGGIEQLLAPRLQTSTHGRSRTRACGPTRNRGSADSFAGIETEPPAPPGLDVRGEGRRVS